VRVTILAVGRLRRGPLDELIGGYAERLSGPPLGPLTVREVEVRGRLPPAEQARRESEALLAAVPAGAAVVALDERGQDLDSAAFAARLRDWIDGGTAEAAFLIGGAEGHGEAVRARADLTLAFGRMTWPHLLCRAMLAEQLYRAHTILTGHPYHRG